MVDIVEEGFDLAIRIGERAHQRDCVKLAKRAGIVCASPA